MGLIFVLAKLGEVIEETQGLFEQEVIAGKTRQVKATVNCVYIIISLLLAVDFPFDLHLIVKEKTVFGFGIEKSRNFSPFCFY